MIRSKRVKMRHKGLSEQRSKKQGKKVDVTVDVREDQVAAHEKSGWRRVAEATPAKTTEKES